MKLVIREMFVIGKGLVGYCIYDEHTGLRYPDPEQFLLTKEQANSPVVHEAAATYIGYLAGCRPGPFRLKPASNDPFFTVPEHRLKEAEAKLQAANESICKLCNTIAELRRQVAGLTSQRDSMLPELLGLRERNDRQKRIIEAVQGAVRGGCAMSGFRSGASHQTLAEVGDALYVKGSHVLTQLKHNEFFVGLNVASLVSWDEQNNAIKRELVMRDGQGRQLVHVAGHTDDGVLRDFQQACMDYNDLKLKAAEQHG
ncbi:MAG: hypothetical protein RR853_04725 [Aurantimicrobium sp.]